VTVDLYWDSNGNGVLDAGDSLVGSTVTAADGSYSFNNLGTDDGGGDINYFVHVSDDNNVLGGYWHSLGTAGQNNNSQADPYLVTLTPTNATNDTADFGYYIQPAAIGNRVWLDSDKDGIQDPGEPGIGGVEVTLTITWPDTSTTVLKTTTDSNGWYSFRNLLLDEDFNGLGTVGAEPTFTISVNTTQTALAANPFPTVINATGSTIYNDSNDPAGTPAQATQGQNDTSNDSLSNASYDFGFSVTPLSILLAGFDVASQADHVLVAWETVSEASNSGFNLYRSLSADGEYALLGFTPSAAPGSTQGAAYSYQDFAVTAGQVYWYKLEDIDLSGAATMHDPVSVVFQAPTAVELSGLAADGGPGSLALPSLLAALLAAGAAALLVDRRRRSAA
jgi:hypothetical protein